MKASEVWLTDGGGKRGCASWGPWGPEGWTKGSRRSQITEFTGLTTEQKGRRRRKRGGGATHGALRTDQDREVAGELGDVRQRLHRLRTNRGSSRDESIRRTSLKWGSRSLWAEMRMMSQQGPFGSRSASRFAPVMRATQEHLRWPWNILTKLVWVHRSWVRRHRCFPYTHCIKYNIYQTMDKHLYKAYNHFKRFQSKRYEQKYSQKIRYTFGMKEICWMRACLEEEILP